MVSAIKVKIHLSYYTTLGGKDLCCQNCAAN